MTVCSYGPKFGTDSRKTRSVYFLPMRQTELDFTRPLESNSVTGALGCSSIVIDIGAPNFGASVYLPVKTVTVCVPVHAPG